MKNLTILIAVSSIAFIAVSDLYAQQGGERHKAPEGQDRGFFRPMMEEGRLVISLFDSDNNGEIAQKEWLDIFKKIDADGDGKITHEELEKNNQQFRQEMLKQRFETLDKNSDGSLSKDEYGGREQFFNRIDANSDGKLTLDELQSARNRMRGPREGDGVKEESREHTEKGDDKEQEKE